MMLSPRGASGRVPSVLVAALMASLSPPASSAQSPHPADLVPRDDTSFDANGLALNPIWGWQRLGRRQQDIDQLCGFVAGPGLRSERPLLLRDTSCTSQRDLIVLNERKTTVAAGYACNQNTDEGELQGHVNWFIISANGLVSWESYERGNLGQDHDVTLRLDTLLDIRGTLDAKRAREKTEIEIEFNGDEVLDWAATRLPPWWKTLWLEAQSGDSVPGKIVSSLPAMVTGVFGLDAIHEAHAELHPVYALALLASQTSEAAATREHWVFFVRNGGNEGECSNGFLAFRELPTDSVGRFVFRFTVPWRQGASDVAAQWDTGASAVITGTSEAEGPRLRKQAGRGVQMTFALPQPVRKGKPTVIVGELDLVWRGGLAEIPARMRERELAAVATQQGRRKRAREPGHEFEAKLSARPDIKQQAALQLLLAERDSNTYAPTREGPDAIVTPPHDVALKAGQLVLEAPRAAAAVFIWRGDDADATPPPLPCNRSVPGCLSNVRKGVAAGSIVSRGGGLVARVILGETKTLRVRSPLGPFPLFSIRFAVGIDRVNPPLRQAAGGVTLVNPSLGLIVRLPSSRVLGPYALGGLDGYFGSEGGVGASVGLGARLRTGLPALPFVEVWRSVRFGRPDYWAWELGVLAPFL